jgi:hypothetical protein
LEDTKEIKTSTNEADHGKSEVLHILNELKKEKLTELKKVYTGEISKKFKYSNTVPKVRLNADQ